MAKNPQQDHLSSKRHFHWTRKVGNEEDEEEQQATPITSTIEEQQQRSKPTTTTTTKPHQQPKKKLSAIAIFRLKSVIAAFHKNRLLHHHHPQSGLGTRVVGTLFGHRRGHVHFAFQKDPSSRPAFLIELATPISGLVKEMASGLVRIALECDKERGGGVGGERKEEKKRPPPPPPAVGKRLLEEGNWRTYCNGKKCGFANRRECGEKEWKVLKAVEPISMGAGVLPAGNGDGDGDGGGEIMYMRAKFERIVGSRDSEAFYMMNPDSNGAPELSIYLLRV